MSTPKTLEEKLKEILDESLTDYEFDPDGNRYTVNRTERITAIIQAIKEEGYVTGLLSESEQGYMTGAEWYKKFERELATLDKNDDAWPQLVLEAARKAAGLES